MNEPQDGAPRSLDPRSIRLNRVVGCIITASVSLPLGAGVAALWVWANLPPTAQWLSAAAWLIVTVALGAWLYRWAALYHRYASYTVNRDGMQISTGVIWRKAVRVPRSRVQHTDVSQGPLERRFGLGTLSIHTAGTRYAKVSLDGLAHETALEIRDHLLPLEESDAV